MNEDFSFDIFLRFSNQIDFRGYIFLLLYTSYKTMFIHVDAITMLKQVFLQSLAKYIFLTKYVILI